MRDEISEPAEVVKHFTQPAVLSRNDYGSIRNVMRLNFKQLTLPARTPGPSFCKLIIIFVNSSFL